MYKIKVNKKTTYRYMKYLGISSCIRRKKVYSREKKDTRFEGCDLIKMIFKANEPFEKIFTDVTHLKINGKKYYLSATIDGFNNEILDYQLSSKHDNKFIIKNIKETLKKCCGKIPIIHNDHGSNYTSIEYQVMTEKGLFKQSFGRVGKCLDNRLIEYFFSIFKTEF